MTPAVISFFASEIWKETKWKCVSNPEVIQRPSPDRRTYQDLAVQQHFREVDALAGNRYMDDYMFLWWRSRYAMYIGALVLLTLFKLDFFSPGWNVIVGLVVTAVLFILSGLIGGGLPP